MFLKEEVVFDEFILWLEFVNSLNTPAKADPKWAPYTALSYEDLGLLISARKVGLPISLTLIDSIKH